MDPTKLFKVKDGSISRNTGEVGESTYCICVELEPFIWDGEVITTKV